MKQKPSELMKANEKQVVELDVVSKGYQSDLESVSSDEVPVDALDHRNYLPHSMWIRYHKLLRCASPEEQARDDPISLSLLEEKYGHLVEKDFWYDRVVRMAGTFLDLCDSKESVFDKTRQELEDAVGHLVPFTEEEEEYNALFENYKKSKVQIDGRPTLQYLRKHHSAPPKEVQKSNTENREQNQQGKIEDGRYVEMCPIHEDMKMKCLNPDQSGVLFFKCTEPDCCVFWTSDSRDAVCHELFHSIHPSVWDALCSKSLRCECGFTPRMKLSRSEKNNGRVFLTCFKKDGACGYFQWIHWKVRKPKGPMDRYATVMSFVKDEGQRQREILQKVRQDSAPTFGSARWGISTVRPKRVEELKRDECQSLLKSEPWPKHPRYAPDYDQKREAKKRASVTRFGFTPSPNYDGSDFVRGLYLPNQPVIDYDDKSCYF